MSSRRTIICTSFLKIQNAAGRNRTDVFPGGQEQPCPSRAASPSPSSASRSTEGHHAAAAKWSRLESNQKCVATPLWPIESRFKLLSGHVQPCQPALPGLIQLASTNSATGPCCRSIPGCHTLLSAPRGRGASEYTEWIGLAGDRETYRAGQVGIEPTTAGFGNQCSANWRY